MAIFLFHVSMHYSIFEHEINIFSIKDIWDRTLTMQEGGGGAEGFCGGHEIF